MKMLLRKIHQILNNRRTKRLFTRMISVAAAVVVFVTTYALVLPAITMEIATAKKEPGIVLEQTRFKADGSAVYVIAADSDAEAAGSAETMTEEAAEEEPSADDSFEEKVSEENSADSAEKVSAAAEEVQAVGTAEAMSEEATEEESSANDTRQEKVSEENSADPAERISAAAEEEDGSAREQENEAAKAAERTASERAENADADQEEAGTAESKNSGSSANGTSAFGTAGNPAAGNSSEAEESSSTGNNTENGIGSAIETSADTEEVSGDSLTGTNAEAFEIPTLEELDFGDILTDRTAFYYYHAEGSGQDDQIASDEVDDWKKVDSETILAPQDFVRVYLSYEIPSGALNKTNTEARYRIPDGLELSDRQIENINKYENGLAAAYKDENREMYEKYLGAEAVEGTATPDQKSKDAYISATVKVEKVYKNKEYIGQDLVFTFLPYTVEQNQINYDETGKVYSRGKAVEGGFSFDLTTGQIDFEKTRVETEEIAEEIEEEIEDSENDIVSRAQEIQYSEAEILFVEKDENRDYEIRRTLTLAKTVETEGGSRSGEDTEKGARQNSEEGEGEDTETAARQNSEEGEGGDTETAVNQNPEEGEGEEDGLDQETMLDADFLETKALTREGADYTVIVSYGLDAQIPENAELSVREIEKDTDEYASYYEQAQSAVDGEKSVNEARFFDISILADGEEVEPAAPVNVQINFTGIEQTKAEDAHLLHYKDDEVQVMDEAEFSKSEGEGKEESTVDTVQFETDGFSVYGIVGTETVTVPFTAGDGRTYEVTVTYDSEAEIPEGASLEVREVKADSEKYGAYRDAARQLLTTEESRLGFLKLLDISIVKDGDEIEPGSPVNVSIRLLNSRMPETDVQVLHFGEETEVLPAESNSSEVSFETDGFSVFGVAYTVDFTYNGYAFSMPGEGTILLSEIFGQLHIDRDAAGAMSLDFTDGTLIAIDRLEGDWMLTSLQPFDTTERLTITMDSGEVIEIQVTDAQLSSITGASFMVELDGAGTNIGEITYWETWQDAVEQVNKYTRNRSHKITVLRDCDVDGTVPFASDSYPVTIDGGGHTLRLVGEMSDDFIVWKKNTRGADLTINNLTIDGDNALGSISFVKNISQSTTTNTYPANGAITITNSSFYRGGTSGILLSGGTKNLTLTNCTVDGQNREVSTSLVRMGTGTLTLDGTEVKGSKIVSVPLCAVEAAAGAVNVTNNVKVTGNTRIEMAGSSPVPANLNVSGNSRLMVTGVFRGQIGVHNQSNYIAGMQFGSIGKAGDNRGTFTNDIDATATATVDGSNLVWSGSQATSGNVVKITDESERLLYYEKTTGTGKNKTTVYEPAVFDKFETIATYLTNSNNAKPLFYENGEAYSNTGPVRVELLKDYVTVNTGVTIKGSRNVTFTSATTNPPDGKYKYEGKLGRGMLRFTNGGTGNNTDKRFVLQTADGTTIRYENIIVDGRADQGSATSLIQADQGALIQLGDRGNTSYKITLELAERAILQNGASNTNDQAGAIYAGQDTTLKMLDGSIIQQCYSIDGNDASGGAIYLANSTFYIEGGIIRNCYSSKGGAVDIGGYTDTSVSDKARIYLSGSPQIIDNYDNNGNPLNLHLKFDNNLIINSQNLNPDARIGVYVEDDYGRVKCWTNHGSEGQPFGTIQGSKENLFAFKNDRNRGLVGEASSDGDNLIVWVYAFNVKAVEDYCIDEAIHYTVIQGSESVYTESTYKGWTINEFDANYHNTRGYILNKKAAFDHGTLESVDLGEPGVRNEIPQAITNLKYEKYLKGRRWCYSTDNGANYSPLEGRPLSLHYLRVNRDNIRLTKTVDTSVTSKIPNTEFTLYRANGTGGWEIYKKGTGKGKVKDDGTEVKDTSANGVYTTNANGEIIMNLPEGSYRLRETKAADGFETAYNTDSAAITFKVEVDAVQDIPANEQVSPYRVVDVSGSNVTWKGNDYDTWKTEKIFGTMTAVNTRTIALHTLVQTTPGVYKDLDVHRTTRSTTAAPGEGEKNITSLNPVTSALIEADARNQLLHIYKGTGSGNSYTLDTSTEITTLTGTTSGIQINGNPANLLGDGEAVYYIFGLPTIRVTITKVWADSTLEGSDKTNGNTEVTFDIYGVTNPAGDGTATKTKLDETLTLKKDPGDGGTAWTASVDLDPYDSYELAETGIKRSDGIVSADEVKNYTTNYVWDGTGTQCTVTNTRKVVSLQVRKADATDTDIRLGGAHFSLQRRTLAGAWEAYGESEYVTSDGTGGAAEGEFTLSLPGGTYRLIERTAPGGYVILQNTTEFTVQDGNTTLTAGQSNWASALSADGTTVSGGAATGTGTGSGSGADAAGSALTAAIRITNERGAELPSTGGGGPLPYTLSGIAMLALFALMFGFRMRRRERRLRQSL